MAGFTSLSQWIQVATAVMSYAAGLQITGLVTHNWCRTSLSQMGLFQPATYIPASVMFDDPEDVCIRVWALQPAWLYVVRVFIFLATVQSIIATVVIFAYTCMSQLNGQRNILLFIIIDNLVIVSLNSIGCIVFVLELPGSQHYSWSYIEILCASGLSIFASFLTVMEVRKLD
ncbi:Hypothetical predicted protein [Octopus vulgaris]|uniref:Uncharacterized protein n=1 Tax=Octopus vulgaris TaxID=6645 RepID=A0AA36BSN3_OCTVU|nr:Hypothetical predicted protein [Octopus vulgaris]